MDTGLKISASGHGVLLLAALIGWPFMNDSAEMAPETVSVSLVSSADLPAPGAIEPPQAPREAEELAALPPPAPETLPSPIAPESRPDPVTEARPPAPAAPEAPPPPPVDRVAPVPQPLAPPEVPTGETRQDAVQQSPELPSQAVQQEEQPAQAPEAAAPQIVTEATETTQAPTLAPVATPRPQQRPARPDPVVQTPPTEPDPVDVAEPAPSEPAAQEPTPSAIDPITAAIAEALGAETRNDTPLAAASGPPLTLGERESLRLSVGQCWNFSALSTDAAKVTVVVGMAMSRDGRPSNLRLVSFTGGGQGAAQQAYETARRAILRCAGDGYSLPREKYDQWREIEMTFNPENMRRK